MKNKKNGLLNLTEYVFILERRFPNLSDKDIAICVLNEYEYSLDFYNELFYLRLDGREFHIFSKIVIIEQKLIEL